MPIPIRPLALALSCALPTGAWAGDLPPLGQVEAIAEGLIATAIAYEIGERCEGIDGRRVMGLAFLWSLRSQAQSMGYSNEEIEAFIDDDAEKDRLEAVARQRLRDMGAVEGDWDSYCRVGRAEIARDSQIGRLLDD